MSYGYLVFSAFVAAVVAKALVLACAACADDFASCFKFCARPKRGKTKAKKQTAFASLGENEDGVQTQDTREK